MRVSAVSLSIADSRAAIGSNFTDAPAAAIKALIDEASVPDRGQHMPGSEPSLSHLLQKGTFCEGVGLYP